MGLSNCLNDAPTDSIPILFIAATAAFFSSLRSFFFGPPATADAASSGGLAGLVSFADFLNSNPPFAYDPHSDSQGGGGDDKDCVVCLCGMKGGDRVRRLSCCHVFHSECLDGWFDQMKLSCPLCRFPLTTTVADH